MCRRNDGREWEGGQPTRNTNPAAFFASDPSVLGEGVQRQKIPIQSKLKKCLDKIRKPVDRLRFIGLLRPDKSGLAMTGSKHNGIHKYKCYEAIVLYSNFEIDFPTTPACLYSHRFSIWRPLCHPYPFWNQEAGSE